MHAGGMLFKVFRRLGRGPASAARDARGGPGNPARGDPAETLGHPAKSAG